MLNNEIIFSTNSIIPFGDRIPQITDGSEFDRTVIEDGKIGDWSRLYIYVEGFTRQANGYVTLAIFDKDDEAIAYQTIKSSQFFDIDINGYRFDGFITHFVELENGNNIFKYRIGSVDHGVTYLTSFTANYEKITNNE